MLITGGAGFIGANLCRALANDPSTRVVVSDDHSTGSRDNLAGVDVKLTKGSILDPAVVDTHVEDADVVVHLAARKSVPLSIVDPVSTHEVNATGTIDVLKAARRTGGRHLVVASSSVYGAHPELPTREDQPTRPVSPYGASKFAVRRTRSRTPSRFTLPVLALRVFNVFGPLQPADHAYAAVVPSFVAAALAGRPLGVHGDGGQTRDFTFVDSVVSALVAAIEGQVTCLDPGEPGLRDAHATPRARRWARTPRSPSTPFPVDNASPMLGGRAGNAPASARGEGGQSGSSEGPTFPCVAGPASPRDGGLRISGACRRAMMRPTPRGGTLVEHEEAAAELGDLITRFVDLAWPPAPTPPPRHRSGGEIRP